MSCLFCLFCFHTSALTPSPCPPCFQADAAAAGVVGRGRAVCQGSTATAAWAQLRPQDALAAWNALARLVPAAAAVAVPRRLHGGIPSPGRDAEGRTRPPDAPPLATPEHRSAARARHRDHVEDMTVLEAAGATGGGCEGTGGAGHVHGGGLRPWRPRGSGLFNNRAAVPLRCRSGARVRRGGHDTAGAACGPARSLAAAAALRERPLGRARSSSRPRLRLPWRLKKSRLAKGWRERAAKSEAKGQHLASGGRRQRAEAPEERGNPALRQNRVTVHGD